MKRGFEIVSYYKDKDINLPVRKTRCSAGYDLETAEDVILHPGEVTFVNTGLKAYMQGDEYLGIHIRSGISMKYRLSLINSQGIIDADYYNNPENEGHIVIGIYNHGSDKVMFEKGTRIAQGVFYKYLTADDDDVSGAAIRVGGMGSTGR